MALTINEARQEIHKLMQSNKSSFTKEQQYALLLAEQALKTIADMNSKGD